METPGGRVDDYHPEWMTTIQRNILEFSLMNDGRRQSPKTRPESVQLGRRLGTALPGRAPPGATPSLEQSPHTVAPYGQPERVGERRRVEVTEWANSCPPPSRPV
jgi:hypothetical protein